MRRLEQIVARLPEATRVDVEAWGGHPTFRVRVEEWIRTSYSLVAPKKLTRQLPDIASR